MSHPKSALAELSRIGLPLLIVAMGIGGFLVFGQRPTLPPREETGSTAPLVETTQVRSFDKKLPIEVSGVAIPYRQVKLSAEVPGRITRKESKSRAGSYVHQNDFLLQIDPTDYDLEVARLQSELTQADEDTRATDIDISNTRSLIDLARRDLVLQRKDLTRREKLRATRVISENDLDDARRLELAKQNALQTLQNQLAAYTQRKRTLKAARERVHVQLQRAQADRKRTGVVSPVSGTVVADYVEQGSFVKKGDPLFLLNETSRMEVKCSLRIDQLYWLWMQHGAAERQNRSRPETRFELPNTKVDVVFRLHGVEYIWDGVLSRYEGTGLDVQTRMIPCRVRIDAPTRVRTAADGPRSGEPPSGGFSLPTLFSGMFVTIRIPIAPAVPLLAIPAVAVRPGGQVWVVRKGTLRLVIVKVILTTGETAVVRQPAGGELRSGDKVVTSPLSSIRTGMPVTEVAAQ